MNAPAQYSSTRTGYGEFLKFNNSESQKIIGTENGNTTYFTVDRLVISGGDGYDTGEGGDIYLWAGRSGTNGGSGGDIKVDGGNSYGGSEGGTIKIRGGNSDTGTGGFIEMWAGSGSVGAPIRMYTWNSNISQWNNWTFTSIGTLNLPDFGTTPGSGDGNIGDLCRNGDVLYFKNSTGWKTVGLS